MYKKLWMMFILFIMVAGVEVMAISTLSLTGTAPPTVYYSNNGNRIQIVGTINVTRTTTAAGEVFTVDLSPVSTARDMWYINGNIASLIQITETNVYISKNGGNRDIIKMWDVEQNLTSNSAWTGTFDQGETSREITFYLSFRYDGILAAGYYQFNYLFRVRAEAFNKSNLPQTSPIATLTITPTVAVASAVSVSFQASDGLPISTLAFYEASTTTKDFNIVVLANFIYRMSATSTNGGLLVHQISGATDEVIPYKLWVTNMTLNVPLAAGIPTILFTNQDKTFNTPRMYASRITIEAGDLTNYTAGKYTDTVNILIDAN